MSRLFDATRIIEERQKAALKADLLLAQAEAGTQPIAILDLETTDMSGKAEPVQITAIDHNGVPLINTLVKPGCQIGYQAMETHGISWNMVANAPTFPEVVEEFRRAVSGRIVICWNIKFDRRIIRQTIEKYKIRPPGAAGYECAMLLYGQFKGVQTTTGKFKDHKLSLACEQCGVTNESAHEALADCLATLGVLQYVALQKYAPTKK
jgi:DNA polymerase III epsilon subunit-like protein